MSHNPESKAILSGFLVTFCVHSPLAACREMSDKIKQKTKNISTKSDYSLPKIGSSVYTISLFWFPLQENSSRAEFLFRSCPSCVQVHFRLRRSIFVFNLDFLFKFMCEFVIYFFGLSLFSCCSFFFQWHSCADEYNF